MIDQYGNQFWTSTDWDDFFDKLDKVPGTVRQKFKDHPLFAVSALSTNFDFANLSEAALNRMLYAICGKRYVSPVVCDLDEELTDASVEELAEIIVSTYKEKWDRQKAVYDIEYDPIYNYKEIYSEETTGSQVDDIDVAKSKANSLAKSGSDTETTTYNTTNTATIDQDESETSNGETGVFGFNSNSSVGSDTSSSTASNALDSTRTDVKTGTETKQYTLGTTHTGSESGSEAFDASTTTSGTKEYTKTGNIGNLKTQEMIEAEIKLWRWNILNEMMNDIKEFISLPVYG